MTRWASRLVGVQDPQTVRARLMGDAALFTAPDKAEAFFAPDAVLVVKNAETALAETMKTAPQIPTVMAVEDAAKPENVPVHVRGSTQNLGDIVPRDFPQTLKAVCSASEVPDEKGSGRLALARWLTRPQHPLTARVQVNRVWQHLFGEGLVRTPDNWGVKGEKPTHPELLDYLASTFITQDRWSQKKLIRRLVLSSTYQMATVATPQITQRASLLDPENRRFVENEPPSFGSRTAPGCDSCRVRHIGKPFGRDAFNFGKQRLCDERPKPERRAVRYPAPQFVSAGYSERGLRLFSGL